MTRERESVQERAVSSKVRVAQCPSREAEQRSTWPTLARPSPAPPLPQRAAGAAAALCRHSIFFLRAKCGGRRERERKRDREKAGDGETAERLRPLILSLFSADAFASRVCSHTDPILTPYGPHTDLTSPLLFATWSKRPPFASLLSLLPLSLSLAHLCSSTSLSPFSRLTADAARALTVGVLEEPVGSDAADPPRHVCRLHAAPLLLHSPAHNVPAQHGLCGRRAPQRVLAAASRHSIGGVCGWVCCMCVRM